MRIAVIAYWNARRQQAKKQKYQGKKNAGTRGEVTGGQETGNSLNQVMNSSYIIFLNHYLPILSHIVKNYATTF